MSARYTCASTRKVMLAGRVLRARTGADEIGADALLLRLRSPGKAGNRNVRRRGAALTHIDVAAAVPRMSAAVDAEVVSRVGTVFLVMSVRRAVRIRGLCESGSGKRQQRRRCGDNQRFHDSFSGSPFLARNRRRGGAFPAARRFTAVSWIGDVFTK